MTRGPASPSFTSTQPTAGLGQVVPSARPASASAARICATSARAGLFLVFVADGVALMRAQGLEELLEVARLAEILVHRGEADIGDRIEARERLHHELADLARRDFALARALEAPRDRIDDALDALLADRPLPDGDHDRAQQLVAVERRALAVLLHHDELAQLHALE